MVYSLNLFLLQLDVIFLIVNNEAYLFCLAEQIKASGFTLQLLEFVILWWAILTSQPFFWLLKNVTSCISNTD